MQDPVIIKNLIKKTDRENITGIVEQKLPGNRYRVRLSTQKTMDARSFIPDLEISSRVVIADTEAGRMITGSGTLQAATSKIYWIRG